MPKDSSAKDAAPTNKTVLAAGAVLWRASDDGAEPDVIPIDFRIREPLEHHGEQQGNHGQRDQDADEVKDPLLHVGSGKFANGS